MTILDIAFWSGIAIAAAGAGWSIKRGSGLTGGPLVLAVVGMAISGTLAVREVAMAYSRLHGV